MNVGAKSLLQSLDYPPVIPLTTLSPFYSVGEVVLNVPFLLPVYSHSLMMR